MNSLLRSLFRARVSRRKGPPSTGANKRATVGGHGDPTAAPDDYALQLDLAKAMSLSEAETRGGSDINSATTDEDMFLVAWEAIHASEAARDHQPAVKTFVRRLHAEYAAGRVTKGGMDDAKTALLQPDVDIASVLTAWKVQFDILDDCDGGGDDDGGGGGDGDAGADASAAAAPATPTAVSLREAELDALVGAFRRSNAPESRPLLSEAGLWLRVAGCLAAQGRLAMAATCKACVGILSREITALRAPWMRTAPTRQAADRTGRTPGDDVLGEQEQRRRVRDERRAVALGRARRVRRVWHFVDKDGNEQGPFSRSQMRDWLFPPQCDVEAKVVDGERIGYFTRRTRVKNAHRMENFVAIGDLFAGEDEFQAAFLAPAVAGAARARAALARIMQHTRFPKLRRIDVSGAAWPVEVLRNTC